MSVSGNNISIKSIDHFVMTVNNIKKTAEFYNKVLGMEIINFSGGRTALKFGDQKINLHEFGNEFDPKADKPTPGSQDFCLITGNSIDSVINILHENNVKIIEGPTLKTGAMGKIMSVYFRDPDKNLMEVSNYR